ncbi:alcohol dehydrogenase catalytic domain-containing protein [Mycolicibacterium peregrinum]|uniref:alcohol dehydrogenase catalytic domain-containing protein n=1 Tax=Mycolicibacterium peregrinum TaxID=43304 RepID=UPI003AAD91B2
MNTMSAVGSFAGLSIDDPQSLQDITVELPTLRPHDILVRVLAVSVNPVDIKRRAALQVSDVPTILGYDAAGIVEAIGRQLPHSPSATRSGTRAMSAVRAPMRSSTRSMNASRRANRHRCRSPMRRRCR